MDFNKIQFGKSDLMVSPIAFGGNVFGWTLSETESFRILDEFYDHGFNFIDTADSYSIWVPGHQGGDLVHAEETDRLVHRFRLARAAEQRRIGQFQQRARHAHVAGHDVSDGHRRRLVAGQLALHVGQQARTRRDADRAHQFIDLALRGSCWYGRWTLEDGGGGHGIVVWLFEKRNEVSTINQPP